MRRLVKALAGALGVGLLMGAAGPGGAAAGSGPPGGGPAVRSVLDWRPCPRDPAAECGSLRLPVDWARPSGAGFDLAVARRKAADPARRIGVLLVNPGGPGDSGVDFAVRRAPSYFSPDILARFDIVGFDPRGIGDSAPIRCSQGLLDRRPPAYPRDQAEFERLVAFNRALRKDCRRHSGPVFDHADTLSVVQDMDALRQALGERTITYFGHSYGTLIGQQYAERYGERLRAMTLTANVDHSLGAREFMVSSAAGAEDSFHQFVRWCARTDSCALHGRDVTAVWDRLLKRADRGEVSDPRSPDHALTATMITAKAFRAFYGPDRAGLATELARLDAQPPPPGPLEPPRPSPPPDPAFHAVFCQDWRIRAEDHREYARLTAAEVRAAPHMRGAPRVHEAASGCMGWPEEVNNPQRPLRITKAPRILMLHSRHDPAAHYTVAAHVHRQTRGTTVLLPYEGAGHSVYGRSDCTRGAVDDYLTDLRLPSIGSCAAVTPSARGISRTE
ncbi:alpha/beta fold hydrolase [Streptomyces yaizuensis]|uniref:Alpha/beta hydrolase n=1 Tax=Streptomyces yaizuensis TaxID=2989713 RepID=A0ABQ5NYK6_9ACTN|nr:alpha/beta fold hydrolase [Streptomyces sp. YSPA8]GLF95445.1 alpha/beta hydrolase [Streptomyces sp. YSPA8]